MPHNHQHSTHADADNWTNIAAAGEAMASFVSDAYWLATLFDLASNCRVDALGLSFYGIAFGASMAAFSAGGAAYSHRTLNTHHQPRHADDSSIVNYTGHSHAPLTVVQKVALMGDFISHAGDIAGPVTFVVGLATNNALPRWGKAIVQYGASLFGGLASVANVRTCKDAMETTNLSRETTLLLAKP